MHRGAIWACFPSSWDSTLDSSVESPLLYSQPVGSHGAGLPLGGCNEHPGLDNEDIIF